METSLTNFYIFPHEEENWELIKLKIVDLTKSDINVIKLYQTLDYFSHIRGHGVERSYKKILSMVLAEFEEINYILGELIPFLATMALKVENLFPDKLEIFNQSSQKEKEVSLSKEQCLCLVSHIFFGTLLLQNNKKLPNTYHMRGWLTFGFKDNRAEKFKCILTYFKTMHDKYLSDEEEYFSKQVKFTRMKITEEHHGGCTFEDWLNSNSPLSTLEIDSKGSMFDYSNTIQVDFANKYLGGGVLNSGNSQEEIMFAIMPECLVGIIFNEFMLCNEAILIKNVERFADYTGYVLYFKFANKHYKGVVCDVLAIDALHYDCVDSAEEYLTESVLRELNKAYVGFYVKEDEKKIVSGNWGCGVFNGNTQLKFLLQWIAGSRANKSLVYCSFNDKKLKMSEEIIEICKETNIGNLFKLVINWCISKRLNSLFEYIKSVLK